MKIRQALAVLGLTFGVAAGAFAQSSMTAPYFGLKAGLLMSDSSYYDNAFNIGGLVGMNVVDLKRSGAGIPGTIAVEGELTMTALKGDINFNPPPFYPGITGKWSAWTLGGYGVYRTPDANGLYFKGKLGIVYSDVSTNVSGISGSGTSTDLALGLGGGYKLSQQNSIEAELTFINHLTFLSFGFNF